MAAFSMIFGIYILLSTLINGTDVPGYPSLMVMIAFLSGYRLQSEFLALVIAVEFLVGFVNDVNFQLPRADLSRYENLRLCLDDLKAFYMEAAMAKPGPGSDIELANWYYGATNAAQVLIALNKVCANTDDPILVKMSKRRILPAHQQHRKI